MSVLFDTVRDCRETAAEHPAVLVAFSGGKDSWAVLDLCLRHFERVECFHFEFISDMDVTRERVAEPLARLGVPCRYYPDPVALDAYRRGAFRNYRVGDNLVYVPTDREAYREAAAAAGIPLVATGKKKSDYRQRAFHMNAGRVFGWHPLADWRKADVLGYLKVRGITPPESHAEAGGIDLTAASLKWLASRYPADYGRLLEWFPHAEAIVRRPPRDADEVRGVPPGGGPPQ